MAYFEIGQSGPKKPSAKAKSKDTTKTAAATPLATPSDPAPEKPPQKPAPVERVAAFRFSAAHLAAELTADVEGTNRKYKDVFLEVSGVLERIDPASNTNPPRPRHMTFQTVHSRVACDMLSMVGGLARLDGLSRGMHFTVLGRYGKDGILHSCELLAPVAIADAKYRGKTIEVAGAVDAVVLPAMGEDTFPLVRLEGETNSNLQILCFFKKAEAEQLKQVPRGVRVIIQGMCSGRKEDGRKIQVRLDNCRFVFTTGPESSVPRISSGDLARDYEEDLRPYYVPPRGKEARLDTLLSVSGLSKEWKGDGKNLEKYHYRIVTVSGILGRRLPPNEMVLESGETDQPLKVSCRFSKIVFDEIADVREYRVTGFCTGLETPGTLRLDNCAVDPAQLRGAVPQLTAGFLPHDPGRVFTYDLAVYPPLVKTTKVVRQTWFQHERGITDTVITHTGTLLGMSLFPPEKPENWLDNRRTKKLRVPGPIYEYAITPGFVTMGQRVMLPRGGTQVFWEPVLKLGAKVGESWEWVHQNTKHVYSVVAFEPYRGGRSAIVQELIMTPLTVNQPREVRHVFLEGVGEVERREWLRITLKEKKLIAEKKMITTEDLPTVPPAPAGGKTVEGKDQGAKKPVK